jgi:iron(III) transport system permease protein
MHIGKKIVLFGATVLLLMWTLLPEVWVYVESLLKDGSLDLKPYQSLLTEPRQWRLLLNTVLVTGGAVLLTLLLGVPLAFLLHRTDLPGRRALSLLSLIPLITPPYIAGIAWSHKVFITGAIGIVLMLGFTYFPLVMLLVGRAFTSTDATLEEAALLARGRASTLVTITLRLATPAAIAAALFVLVFALSDFSTPDYFTTTTKNPFHVYATEVFYDYAHLGDHRLATAASVPLVLLALLGVVLIARVEGRGSYTTVGNVSRVPRLWPLGKMRWPVGVFSWLLVGTLALGPTAILLGWSVSRPVSVDEGPPRSAYAVVFQSVGGELLSSLLNATASAALAIALGFFPAYLLARARGRSLSLGTALTLLPFAVPALTLSIGLIRLFNHPDPVRDMIYTGRGLVIIALVARFAPIAVMSSRAALARIDRGVEEAAELAGRSFGSMLVRLLGPLSMRGVLAAFLIVFIFAMRELDSVVLLAGSNETLAKRIYNGVHFAQDALVATECLLMLATILIPVAIARLLIGRPLLDEAT